MDKILNAEDVVIVLNFVFVHNLNNSIFGRLNLRGDSSELSFLSNDQLTLDRGGGNDWVRTILFPFAILFSRAEKTG